MHTRSLNAYFNNVSTVTRRMSMVKRYRTGEVKSRDDFGLTITNVMIDGKTKNGPWAIMTPTSWRQHGVGKLGTGYGQKYEKQIDGRFLKVEG
jgi:cell division protein FtsI/penicillin-binding protein 2